MSCPDPGVIFLFFWVVQKKRELGEIMKFDTFCSDHAVQKLHAWLPGLLQILCMSFHLRWRLDIPVGKEKRDLLIMYYSFQQCFYLIFVFVGFAKQI